MVAAAESSSPTPLIFGFGRAELDEQRRELRVEGRAVPLETKPYELLRVFLHHPGETLSKDELIESVWPGRVVTEGVLAKCVTKLRGALGDDQQQLIRTVHGYGYRWIAVPAKRPAAGAAPIAQPRAGDALPARPHWRLIRELGRGGFGSVWLVEHDKTHERRVFKFAGDGAALQALKREITLYRLLHDSLGDRAAIVRILDWNVDEPPYFIEAEYIAGGNLADWCEARGGIAALAREARLELIARIADALAAAHAIGVLHKDLKPANVLIAGDAIDEPQVRLADFGSGRALEPERLAALGITRLDMTHSRADADTTSGTLLYLAPELFAGAAATVKADIYACCTRSWSAISVARSRRAGSATSTMNCCARISRWSPMSIRRAGSATPPNSPAACARCRNVHVGAPASRPPPRSRLANAHRWPRGARADTGCWRCAACSRWEPLQSHCCTCVPSARRRRRMRSTRSSTTTCLPPPIRTAIANRACACAKCSTAPVPWSASALPVVRPRRRRCARRSVAPMPASAPMRRRAHI